MKYLYTFTLLLFTLGVYGQQCGHDSESWKKIQQEFLSSKDYPTSIVKSGTPAYIPLKIHYIRQSNGAFSVNADPNLLIESIMQLNQILNPINVQFYIAGDIHYIDNSAWLTVDRSQPIPYLAENVAGMGNVYVVDGWTNPNWASGWGSPSQVEINTPILSLVAHEFGHFLTLAHTFDIGNGIENVDRTGPNANCQVAGDGICDTEADPYGLTAGQFIGQVHKDTLCHINSLTYDMNNVLYNPPYDNIMSYHTGDCGRIFSPGQYTKMLAGFNTYHNAYPVYAGAGMISLAPSNVTIGMQNGIPYISWTNQANSMGTSVEYSEDGGTNWYVAMGSLSNVSSLPLYGTKPGVTYTIRLKHINNHSNYSSNINYTPIHALPMVPLFNRQKTTDLQSIGSVKVAGTVIDNASNDNQSYSLTYYPVIPELQVGTNYPLELKIGTDGQGNGGYSYFAVYLDENNDGDFDDAGETKYIKMNGQLEWTVNTTLTPSLTAIGGPRILRVRSFYQAGIQDPDKFSLFSETEDYVVFIKTTSGTAGMENQSVDAFQVYPNPFNDMISLSSNTSDCTYEIYNATGQKCLEGTLFDAQVIDASMLEKGMYTLKLKSENVLQTKKIIKI